MLSMWFFFIISPGPPWNEFYQTILGKKISQFLTHAGAAVIQNFNVKIFSYIMFDPCKLCHCLEWSICRYNFLCVCTFFCFLRNNWYSVFVELRQYLPCVDSVIIQIEIMQLWQCLDKNSVNLVSWKLKHKHFFTYSVSYMQNMPMHLKLIEHLHGWNFYTKNFCLCFCKNKVGTLSLLNYDHAAGFDMQPRCATKLITL